MLNRHLRKEKPLGLAVACPAMVQRDKQRPDLLVIQPLRDNHVDDNRLSGAPAPEKLLDQVVRADVHFPSVAGSVTATFGRVCHYGAPGRTTAHRHFLHASIFALSASVPPRM